MSSTAERPPLGLRERKKARTRAAIQTHALRLFREQGYQSTTVDQIITAAEVSETTFFRYFPTKEDTVLQDDFDPMIASSLRDQPAALSPVAAVRRTLRDHFEARTPEQRREMHERLALVVAEPALRSTMLVQATGAMRLIEQALAARAGADHADLATRAVAGAVIGVLLAAVEEWSEARGELPPIVDAALEHLENGLSSHFNV
ncbi:TetR family transcriptional regulator [Cryptosporangium arvum]|uniref:acyl-CoA-like ligand-binding transcription factor n=1 Tax=Cryptosporangium arvum TaxID=80871 RepID=UPI0004B37D25|nr:TetR family transcriptional regulator [Cryptosporangium arvum]